jgi:predicted nucleic acid-binding protein
MARRPECYLDTSAFIAFLDKSDTHHLLFRRLFSDPPQLVTSSLVIAEGHGWFLRKYDSSRALRFLAFVDALPDLEIRGFDSAAIATVSKIVRKFSGHEITLADAHSLAIMQEEHIRSCWSTDWHLTLFGASLVKK